MRFKKLPILLLIPFTVSCGKNNEVPQEIRDFINGVDFNTCLNKITNGSFSQLYKETNNNQVIGENSIEFTYYRQNNDEYGFEAIYTFSGNQVVNNIYRKLVKLDFVSQENYRYEVKINDEESTITNIGGQEAFKKFYKIYDNGMNPYNFGGLYYGDYFAINMNKYYSLYSLNEDKTVCSIKEEGAEYVGGIFLDQHISINQKGMLLSKEEFAYNQKRTYTGLLTQTGSYTFNL